MNVVINLFLFIWISIFSIWVLILIFGPIFNAIFWPVLREKEPKEYKIKGYPNFMKEIFITILRFRFKKCFFLILTNYSYSCISPFIWILFLVPLGLFELLLV